MSIRAGLLVAVVVLSALTRLAAAQPPTPVAPVVVSDGKLVVYVVNRAGASTALTDGFGTAVKHAGLPLALKTVQWCRKTTAGADVRDHGNHQAAAQALAQEILSLKHSCPGDRIVLLGHSAGARIVLSAAECLPACTVERIVLFAPFVGSYYDVRRALQASRLGIDSFHSEHDTLLDTLGESFQNADGTLGPSAGGTGFALPLRQPDTGSFAGLRQFGWNPVLGISGSHFSWTEPPFLYRWVLPMLMTR